LLAGNNREKGLFRQWNGPYGGVRLRTPPRVLALENERLATALSHRQQARSRAKYPYDIDMITSQKTEHEKPLAAAVFEIEKDYLLQNYARYPILLVRGKGSYVYDESGKRYLDLISGIGVNALGHAHPRIVDIIRKQAGLLIHTSNLYYNEYQGRLAKRICDVSGLQRVFFTNSGTESMEGALKMIRAHGGKLSPDKIEIVSLENSFHGRSLGALSVTGQSKYRLDFEPLLPGVRFAPANDATALEQVVGDKTAGIVVEAIQGEGGVYPMGIEYLRKARELADRYNALLVFDEIQCGVGRPGTFFAYQLPEPAVMPDVMVAAKPIGCGLPLGFIAANERAAASIGPGMHGSTFGGGPLACRVALQALDIIEELLPSISSVGGYFRMRLSELARHLRFIREVRGTGLMIGVELDFPCKDVVTRAMQEGLMINVTHENVVRLLPPYILTEQDVDRAMPALEKVLRQAGDAHRVNA
jgi:acetylornithine/N-succinyldiaminopimelate aminotransferase